MNASAILKRNQSAAYRVYDGKATIVLGDLATVEVLNEIGSLVWERIDGQRTIAQIMDSVLATVVDDYEVGPEDARRDIMEFIETLREHGMVH